MPIPFIIIYHYKGLVLYDIRSSIPFQTLHYLQTHYFISFNKGKMTVNLENQWPFEEILKTIKISFNILKF